MEKPPSQNGAQEPEQRPSSPKGRRRTVVGALTAVAVLLVAGVAVAVNSSGGRVSTVDPSDSRGDVMDSPDEHGDEADPPGGHFYADLPACEQLLDDLIEEIPGLGYPRVGDEMVIDGPGLDHTGFSDAEFGLRCIVADPEHDTGMHPMMVTFYLHDHQDEAGLERLRQQMEVRVAERGSDADLEGVEHHLWEEIVTGDHGFAFASVASYEEMTMTTGGATFLAGNVVVSFIYSAAEGEEAQEVMDFLTSFCDGLERRLSSEGVPV